MKEKIAVNDRKKFKQKSRMSLIWFRFKKNRLAMFGLIILSILLLIAIFADGIVDYEEDAVTQHMQNRLMKPNSEHIFGTDQFGRDIFARIIFGTRISLLVGVLTVVIGLVIGSVIGATAGYYGGTIDNILMRIMDIFMAIPSMLLAITIVAALGPGLFNLLIATFAAS